MLLAQGFEFTPQQLFFLVAIPNLVGSLIRVPYTLAVPRFGGRNWTMISAALLLIPTLSFAYFVNQPGTPYWAFCVIAATAGFGGGNFASSMANINFFYPARLKGSALGLNAAGGNLGVALIQFFLPVIVGGAGIFGLVKASEGGIHLERAAWVYAGLAVAAVARGVLLHGQPLQREVPGQGAAPVLKNKQTWVMSFLYIGTFGSFIGYSAAMPLLIKLNFWRQPVPDVVGIGINFVFYAFLGALIGSMSRPLGGYLADRFGGARITMISFGGMLLGSLGVLWTLSLLETLPPPPDAEALAAIKADPAAFQFPDAVQSAVDANADVFPLFLGHVPADLLLHRHRQRLDVQDDPRDLPHRGRAGLDPGTPERDAALLAGTKKASAAVGIIGAVGAIGGFLIPITFGSPWVTDPLSATKTAFLVFAGVLRGLRVGDVPGLPAEAAPGQGAPQLRRRRHLRPASQPRSGGAVRA